MEEMEAEFRVMDDLKQQIERGRSNFKKSPRDRLTEGYVAARLEGLEEILKKFTLNHENIIGTYNKKVLDESSYMELDVFDTGYEIYLTYKGELKAMLSSITPLAAPSSSSKSSEPSSSNGNITSLVKLPQISLPVFSGNYTEWLSFRDLFISLVHNNPALDNVQRLHYLKTQLKGEAEQYIRYIPITQANYNKCWDLLQHRYNNKRFMSNCILKRLLGQRIMNVETANGIKELLDTTSECVHELLNLNIRVDTWDIIIIYIVSLKLDAETRKQWELFINNKTSEELPTFSQFKEFLECRFRALEFVEPIRLKSKFIPNNFPSNAKSLHVSTDVTCPHCSENHKLYSCSDFSKEEVSKRQDIVRSLRLCFNCLASGHSARTCRVPTTCHICKGRHHTLLHGPDSLYTVAVATEAPGTDQEIEEPESSCTTNESSNIANHFVTGATSNQTLLATALVRAEAKGGYSQTLRALLDQGSQASFISEAAVQLLRLDKITARSCISGVGGGQSGLTSKYMVIVDIQSLHDPTFKLQIKAHVLKRVTSVLPDKKFTLPSWTELKIIPLADPQYNSPNKINILLGSEVYCQILQEGLIKNPSGVMIAQNTYLGWILSGQVNDNEGLCCHNIYVNTQNTVEDNELLKIFWEIESEPHSMKKILLTPEEQECEKHFNETTCRTESGRYVVELPFRKNSQLVDKYGDTRTIAVKRLLGLERRLQKVPDQKKDYIGVLKEYLTTGHMETVKGESIKGGEGKVWLPHHAVIRMDRTTTKTRVVFNASDRSANGVSLNDTLMVGPRLQPELRHLIMRWRLHPICLTADIVKMYRQVKVAEKHVDYQRIVWREDPRDDIEDFRLLTVTFGTSCAPYLAVKALQQVAVDEGHNFPLAAERVSSDFYMDDLMTGVQTEAEAVELYKQFNSLLERGGFPLQKWTSNRIELLERLEDKDVDKEIKEDYITKILGLTWNRKTDEFNYTVKMASERSGSVTKRNIISEICRLYDPLGWMAPCIITAKVFIQKLWLTGLDWDIRLPDDLLSEWELYRQELMKLVDFHIPRWLQTSHGDIKMELHGFCDASNVAYAAAVYLRCISSEGNIKSQLVTAKTKVAPIKQLSIPRLELCGAVLVMKLLIEVATVMSIDKQNIHAWTDSTIVLAWLSDHPSRWKTFVANRTSAILSVLDSSQWSYVISKENPADCASRGITSTLLLDNELWKAGPNWLRNDVIEYVKPSSICTTADLEKRIIKVHATSTEEGADLSAQFSSLRRFVRIIAYCRRFLRLKSTDSHKDKPLPYITAQELQKALLGCIRMHQKSLYPEEIVSLIKGQTVNKNSKLIALNPLLDKDGLLRVGGRIENANLSEYSKHPFIISGDSQLAKLIIADAHEKTLHGGQQLTCSHIRSTYWMFRLKNLVRSHIHHCIVCIRYASRMRTQLMGQLPPCRVTAGKSFLNAGVDYAGPINIRLSKGRGQRSYKGYICLFVCMSTRAIHIEVVSDLTTAGFLAAFRRFIARRGRCNHLWSDNGSNFIGAAKELKQLFSKERSSMPNEIASALANNGTEWHFIPPRAPNFGGLWEAGVKSTKHHLRRVIGDSTLTYEELATVLNQIEACLNSRPMSSSDADDIAPLTPGHFLVGEPLLTAPDHNYEALSTGTLRRWQLTQRMLQTFWRRWSKEYLFNFFQRYKWNTKTTELKLGDVVIVREDNLPPATWLYGRVVDLHPGKDNITRVVTLRYKDSLIQRPTSKLCLLPINSTDDYY